MWKPLTLLIGALHLLNGAAMWLIPALWYARTPGVVLTGPFNMHFVRDIALVFLVSGAALIFGTLRRDRSLLLAGAAWPALHALFHIWVWLGRGLPVDGVAAANLFAIQLPAWLALIAALKTHQTETIT